jgi:hypothetical protein
MVTLGQTKTTIPATARDLERIHSDLLFKSAVPRVVLGRFHFSAIASPKESSKDLDIQVARKGNQLRVLMTETAAGAPVRFHYQTEVALVGPIFEFSPTASRLYQFQCIATMPEQSPLEEPSPQNGGDSAAHSNGAGAQ